MDSLTAQKISDPAFFELILEHITSGGALPALCQSLKIKYSAVNAWIYYDEQRAAAYSRALAARNEWTISSILNELKDIALADIRQAYDPSGELLPVEQWPPALGRCVQAIETSGPEVKRLKLWDKLRALELLGRNLKLFKDQIELDSSASLESLIAASLEKKQIENAEGEGGPPR